LRDSSAAAVAVCGFQELEKHGVADVLIVKTKEALLNRLCSDDYLDSDDSCPGVLKDGQVGDKAVMAKNVYTSWGDYYLMEALSRELFRTKKFW
jgi:unsaturated chondroitin disaccharide hydrolase